MSLLEKLLYDAVQQEASDIYIIAGMPATFRANGLIRQMDSRKLMPPDTQEILEDVYRLAKGRSMDQLLETGDDDFSFSIKALSRFRGSAFRQRGSLSAVIRVIRFSLPDHRELGIPEQVMELASIRQGMVLVAGTAGSGKSTTLACIIDRINHQRHSHLLTLEDPI